MERILLLEDDKSLVTGLTLALGRAGYALDTARTLAEAGHLWQAGRYDLLMLDVTLPDGTELAVTDVHEQDGILWHSVPSLPDTAVPGITVEEAIDWDWRFDKMQQHTGEHILSGILHQMFGAENVGFHIGSDAVRMDTSVPISAEGLREAELAANRIIWELSLIHISEPTRP